jgi:excisionase family DNA binding protein
MRGPQEIRPVALDVRAFYTVAELARVGGVSTYRLLRLLRRNDVHFLRVGRAYLVSLSEIQRKIPPLWEGLKRAEELRGTAGASKPRGEG